LQNILAQKQAIAQGRQSRVDLKSAAAQGAFDALPLQKLKALQNLPVWKEIGLEATQEGLSQLIGNLSNAQQENPWEGLAESVAGGGGVAAGMFAAKALLGKYGKKINLPTSGNLEEDSNILNTVLAEVATMPTAVEQQQAINELAKGDPRVAGDLTETLNALKGLEFAETQRDMNARINPETGIIEAGISAQQLTPTTPTTPTALTLPEAEAPSNALNALAGAGQAVETIAQTINEQQAPTEAIQSPDPTQEVIRQLQSLPPEQQKVIADLLMQQTVQNQPTPEVPPVIQDAVQPTLESPTMQQMPQEVQTQQQPEQIAYKGTDKPLNEILGEVFNLPQEQADASGQVADAVVQTMAERNNITKEEQLARMQFKQSTPEEVGAESLRQDGKKTDLEAPVLTKKQTQGSPLERQLTPQMREAYDVMPSGKPANKAKKAKVYDNDGTAYDTQYDIVEADALITSNNDDLSVNTKYPAELQPRDRSRAASQDQINTIAQNLTPEKLADSKSITDGSPIIGADNVVESGNGRTLGIRQAYQVFKDKGKAYKQYLKDNAEQFGLSPDAIDGMKAPVLVRKRLTDTDRAAFTKKANESTIAELSTLEQAKNDAAKLTDSVMATLDTEADGGINGEFVLEFMQEVVPQNQQGGIITSSGTLTKDGLRRIQSAILAKAFPDNTTLNDLLDESEETSVNIGKALFATAPTVAEYASLEKAGVVKPFDLSKDIGQAVAKFIELKKQGLKVADYNRQLKLLPDGLTPEAGKLLNILGAYANKPQQLASLIKRYHYLAKQEGDPRQATLFAIEDRSKLELLEDAEVFQLAQGLASMPEPARMKALEELSDKQREKLERMVGCG
jgi:hypothetical protein